MTKKISAAGLLNDGDVKRLARLTRTGSVGPTTVYYAGLTAPVISTSMLLLTRQALNTAGMSDYWQLLLSALIAAFAGIAWYLIFIRWSYRHKFGRGTETSIETKITGTPEELSVTRGNIRTVIGWAAVTHVDMKRNLTVISIAGADALIIPDNWFASESERRAFKASLQKWTV